MIPDAEGSHGAQPGGSEVDARLGELEMQAQFQQRSVEDLDEVVREFAERVTRLETELKELRAQLESLSDGDLQLDPAH
ncbi:MAG: SlyX family protein [Myxococcota bacterium]